VEIDEEDAEDADSNAAQPSETGKKNDRGAAPPPPPPPPLPHETPRPWKRLRQKATCPERVAFTQGGALADGIAPKNKQTKQVVRETTTGATEGKAMEFFVFTQMDAAKSPDARSQLELAIENLAKQLREDPTIPADPNDANKPDELALREDVAVQLPLKHCAFRGCSWESDFAADLIPHLEEKHMSSLKVAADKYHPRFSTEERVVAAYNAALTKKTQEGAPLASYGIDRRCVHQYISKLGDDKTDSLICFVVRVGFHMSAVFFEIPSSGRSQRVTTPRS